MTSTVVAQIANAIGYEVLRHGRPVLTRDDGVEYIVVDNDEMAPIIAAAERVVQEQGLNP